MDGGVLPVTVAATVRVKALAVAFSPSLTVSVTVAVPDCPAAGVREMVRLDPLPLRTMPEVGSRVVFVDVTVTVRAVVDVSAAPTVKARAFTAVPGVVR